MRTSQLLQSLAIAPVFFAGYLSAAQAQVSVNIGGPIAPGLYGSINIGQPGPVIIVPQPQVVYSQPQIVYQQPQVIYQRPQVVYSQPIVVAPRYYAPPVYYAQPAYGYGYGYGHGYRHHHRHHGHHGRGW